MSTERRFQSSREIIRIVLLSVVCCSTCFGATLNIPATFGAFSNAVLRAANEGDIVLIDPGTIIWERNLVIDRNISFTVSGSGTNQTFLVSSNSTVPLWIKSNSTNVFVFANVTIYGSPNDGNGFITTGPNVGSPTPMRSPLHFYNINMPALYARGIFLGSGDSFGLIDHCYFEMTGTLGWNPVAFRGNGWKSWQNPNPLGTSNACFVEDCVFKKGPNAPFNGNGFFDCYDGAQVVLRYNTFFGDANSGAHGYDSGATGVRTGEIYNNTFSGLTNGASILDWRSGTILWYNNTLSGSIIPPAILKLYRGCDGLVSTVSNYCNIPQVLTWTANFTNQQAYQLINQPRYTAKTSITSDIIPRDFLIGSTLADSISNLVQCINLDPAGRGITYTASSTRNDDVLVNAFTSNSLTLTNILDGASQPGGWPAAQQHGVLRMTQYANSPVEFFPCYSWSNIWNGATKLGWIVGFNNLPCNGHNNTTNLLHLGRDYFNDNDLATWAGPPAGYTAFTYPHPLQSVTNSPPPINPPPTNNPPIIIGPGAQLKGPVNLKAIQ